MKHYVFPDKIQRMVKLLYEIFECAVLDERNQSNWFGITTGVGQGFVMSGFYFYYLVMQCYDIPDKIQRMVKLLYETFECTVLDGINQNNHWWETNLCYVRSSISTIYRIQGKKKETPASNQNNTTDATSEAGYSHPSGAHEFTLGI